MSPDRLIEEWAAPAPNAPPTVPKSDAERLGGKTGGLKPPTDKEVQCYRLAFLYGEKKTQKQIAAEVFGDRTKQYRVSRAIRHVELWIKAGNVLPDLNDPKPRVISVDPRKLDAGRRGDTGRNRRA